MQHPWGWWFLNQQKSQTTASSEWGFSGNGMQKVINGISGVHSQMHEKNMQKGKQCEYRPREGPGTARTLTGVSTPNVFGYLCQIQGNVILHTLLMKREHGICGFTLASLLPSPLPCTFFFVNCFLPLPFFFLFANFHPFTRNPQDVWLTFTTLHALPQNITPCSQLAGPAAEWVIIVKIKTSGMLLSSSLVSRTCYQGPGSSRAELPQIQPPGLSEGTGPVQWRILSPL